MTDGRKIRPQDRWDEKAGVASKTYKVSKAVAEEFKQTCERLGVSIGPQVTRLMKSFIEEHKES